MEDLRFPIGRCRVPESITDDDVGTWIDEIETLPARLRSAVSSLTPAQLDTRYRPEGWTVRQVIHHLVDSHANSVTRFKLALTEEHPSIRPYFEDRWAELPDSRRLDVEVSLRLLEALHERWVVLLRALDGEQRARTFHHPESGETVRLDENIGIYAWHGNHHLAHIERLIAREGWD